MKIEAKSWLELAESDYDTRSIEQIIEEYHSAFTSTIQVTEIILFGSHLEGTATEDSDVDVIVVSDDFAPLTEDERLDILEDIAESAAPNVHPWGFTSQEINQASKLTTLGYAREAGIHFRK